MVTLARTSAKRIPGMAEDLRTRSDAVVVRAAMPRVRGREQRRGTRNTAAWPERAGAHSFHYQRISISGYHEVRRNMAGFGRSPRCPPATDQLPLMSCPRATRTRSPSAGRTTGGRSADHGYLWCESASRQANSREKLAPAQSGSHFADTRLFRPGSHLAEIVAPSQGSPALSMIGERIEII